MPLNVIHLQVRALNKIPARTYQRGNWWHLPPGCSFAHAIDHAIHWNDNTKGMNNGQHTPVCSATTTTVPPTTSTTTVTPVPVQGAEPDYADEAYVIRIGACSLCGVWVNYIGLVFLDPSHPPTAPSPTAQRRLYVICSDV